MAEPWNQWRQNPGQEQEQDDVDLPDDEYDDEEEDIDEGEGDTEGEGEGDRQPAAAQQPQFLTADQVEQMISRQNEQFANYQRETLNAVQQSMAPRREEEQLQPPDPKEMKRALEEGDSDRYLELQQQQLLYVQQMTENRIRSLEQAAVQRFDDLNQQTIETQPTYQRYKREVEAMMDDLQLGPSLRRNPKIVSILANAARGQNVEKEFEEMQQQRRRQRGRQATGEPTNARSGRSTRRGRQEQEPVFSPDAMQALRASRRTPDRHAQLLGYKDWADYEAQTAQQYERWDEMNVPSWRRNRA